jgi:hypothetical protein
MAQRGHARAGAAVRVRAAALADVAIRTPAATAAAGPALALADDGERRSLFMTTPSEATRAELAVRGVSVATS